MKNKKYLVLLIVVIILSITSLFFDNVTDVNNIGIVEIEGTIVDSKKFVEVLDDFSKRQDIKAIVLRLDTPGGAVAPSQEIYAKVKKISLDNNKPIIASIGSVAASGGYYIAIGADQIVANSGSITGSIGVIINFPIAADLVEKVGFKFNTVTSGKMKDAGSPYREPTDDENIFFQEIVDDLYNQFITEVSKNRKIDILDLSNIADGRIFTGQKAFNLGLVDTIGTFEDALNISKNLANISGDIKLIYPKEEKGRFLRMLLEESKAWMNSMYNVPMYLYYNY